MDSAIISDTMTETKHVKGEHIRISPRLSERECPGQAGWWELYCEDDALGRYAVTDGGITFSSSDGDTLNVVYPSSFPTDGHIGYKVPTDESVCIWYRYIILHTASHYLTLELTHRDDAKVTSNRERTALYITGSGLSISAECYDSADEAYLAVWRYHLPSYRWHEFGVGVIIDYADKRSDAMVYADLCHRLSCQHILLIVQNYQTDDANSNGLVIDTLQNRAALCCGRLILEYDGRAGKTDSAQDYIMMRAGDKLNIDGVTFTDVLGADGYESASQSIRDTIGHGSGILYKMLWECGSNGVSADEFDKIMVHNDSDLTEYISVLDKTLSVIESLTASPTDGYRFIRNMFVPETASMDMMLTSRASGGLVSAAEQIMMQGYLGLSLELDVSSNIKDTTAFSVIMLPIFMCQNFIVTQDFLQRVSAKDELFKFFNDMAAFRQSLDIHYYDIYHNPNGQSSFPYRIFSRGRRTTGLLLGGGLYIGLTVHSLFRRMFCLPDVSDTLARSVDDSQALSETKWYDIDNHTIMSAGSYLNKSKSSIHYCLAENHILILKEPNVSSDRNADLRMVIYCTGRCRVSIAESDDVIHKFDISVTDDKMTIEYETTPVNRMITFEIVIAGDDGKIGISKSVNYNGDEIFFHQDDVVLQFMSSNIQAKNVIKII